MKNLAALVYILVIGMPGAVTMAATGRKLPDLIPVVVNAYQGFDGWQADSFRDWLDFARKRISLSISSPGRSDGNVARMDGLISKVNKNPDGKIAVGENIEFIDIEAGVYDIGLWPVGHRELEQTLKGVEITSGGMTERKLEFRWPGKKK